MSEQTNAYRVAIVDDEPLARQGLVAAINRIGSDGNSHVLEVVAVCENGMVAIDRVREVEPDILLLDIAMPEVDGFAVLERLEPEETPPAVIFVTAYAEHALRAFDAEALDYVVKPVPDARLKAAIDRAISRVNERRAAREALEHSPLARVSKGSQYLQQFVIPERGTQIVIPIDDVEWIEGDTYYARVHAVPRERLLRERLHVLENLLDPAVFMRIHRSAIVRVSAIREIRADSPYAFSVRLASGARAPLSRDKRRLLEETLEAGRR
ncbi:MAG: LytTR family DNA-binding domain-containing protein [Gemmatimonadales bacterium]